MGHSMGVWKRGSVDDEEGRWRSVDCVARKLVANWLRDRRLLENPRRKIERGFSRNTLSVNHLATSPRMRKWIKLLTLRAKDMRYEKQDSTSHGA